MGSLPINEALASVAVGLFVVGVAANVWLWVRYRRKYRVPARAFANERAILDRMQPASRSSSACLVVVSAMLLVTIAVLWSPVLGAERLRPITATLALAAATGLGVGVRGYGYIGRLVRESVSRSLHIQGALAARGPVGDEVVAADLEAELGVRQDLLIAAGEIRAAESLQRTLLLLAPQGPPPGAPEWVDMRPDLSASRDRLDLEGGWDSA